MARKLITQTELDTLTENRTRREESFQFERHTNGRELIVKDTNDHKVYITVQKNGDRLIWEKQFIADSWVHTVWVKSNKKVWVSLNLYNAAEVAPREFYEVLGKIEHCVKTGDFYTIGRYVTVETFSFDMSNKTAKVLLSATVRIE